MVDEKKLKVCRYIAGHILALGGPDFSDLSEEELIERIKGSCIKAGEALKKMGVSADEATKSLEGFRDAFKKT